MKKLNLLGLSLIAAGFALSSCSEEIFNESSNEAEAYTKAFYNEFGKPGEGHTFSMATRGAVTIKTKDPVDVKIIAKTDGEYFLFADWTDVKNGQAVTFDIPSDVEYVKVLTNNGIIAARLGDVVDVDTREAYSSKQQPKSRNFNNPENGKTVINVPVTYGDGSNPAAVAGVSTFTWTYPAGVEDEDATASVSPALGGEILGRELKQLLAEPYDSYKDGFAFNAADNMFIQIHFAKKLDSPYTIGYAISDTDLDHENGILFKVPLFNSQYMDVSANPGMFGKSSSGHTDDITYYGSQIHVNVNNGTYWVTGTKSISAGGTSEAEPKQFQKLDKWVEDGKVNVDRNYYLPQNLIDSIQHMASLYANHTLPVPADVTGGDPGTILDEGKTLPAYTAASGDDNDYTVNEAFYRLWREYLFTKIQDYKAQNSNNKVYELLFLKHILAYHGANFSPYDYPEVIDEGNGVYCITYRMSETTEGGSRVALDSTEKPAGTLISPDGSGLDDFTKYQGTAIYMTPPFDLRGHQATYYVEYGGETYYLTDYQSGNLRWSLKYISQEDGLGISPAFDELLLDIDGDNAIDVAFIKGYTISGTPDKGFNTYTWLLACEDMGATDDWDFNDLVVSVKYASGNSNLQYSDVKIKALAAGGMYPAYLMLTEQIGENTKHYFIGHEIHKWLGGEAPNFINTEESEYPLSDKYGVGEVTWRYDLATRNVTSHFSLAGVSSSQTFNSDCKFWVLVDKNDVIKDMVDGEDSPIGPTQIGIKEVSAENLARITKQNGVYSVNKNVFNMSGAAPTMLCVGSQWEWPMERKHISKDCYTGFGDWLSNPNAYVADPDDPEKSVKWWFGFSKNGVQAPGFNRDNVVKRITPPTL